MIQAGYVNNVLQCLIVPIITFLFWTVPEKPKSLSCGDSTESTTLVSWQEPASKFHGYYLCYKSLPGNVKFPLGKQKQEFLNVVIIVSDRELQGFYEDGEGFMFVSGSELLLNKGFQASVVVKSKTILKTFLFLIFFIFYILCLHSKNFY